LYVRALRHGKDGSCGRKGFQAVDLLERFLTIIVI
jgi:hypothetical protein